MTLPAETIAVTLKADTSDFRREMVEAARLGRDMGRSLTTALESAAAKGKSLGDVLRHLALTLSQAAFRSALRPLEQSLGTALMGVGGSLGFAKGGAFGSGAAIGFAQGGVVSSPISFPLGGGFAGIAGERGAEAILPLSRGPDGRLGVVSNGGGGVQVNFHVTAGDVESFMRSEGQIAAMLSRVVSRGQRNL
jgi:phage-related minor tail protein